MTDRLAYSLKEAAAICGVSPNTISEATAEGSLRAKRPSKSEAPNAKKVYTRAALEAWLESMADA